MILGIDVSGWNPSVNWDLLYQGGVRFAVIKLTQGTSSLTNLAREHVEGARRVGMVVAGYHWNDPMLDDNKQIDFFASQLDKYDIKLGYVDVEQYWQDWAEFYQSLRDGTPITKIITSSRISQSAYNMMTGLRNRGFSSQIYTRWSFITGRASPMQLWISPEESWYAHYPYAVGRVNITWDDIKPGGKWYPTIKAPYLPAGVKWRMWQFSGDKFILPGTGGIPIDLNLFNGTETELIKFFSGNEIIPEPTQPQEPPTNGVKLPTLKVIGDVRIRTQPSTSTMSNYVRMRKEGETVNVEEIKIISNTNIWVRDHEGWSAVFYAGWQYMK
jgi:GH25 family lysozyme M1 (1,4-beta-N-acetylmuramidase)